jgi:hypothetical protein
VTSASPFDDLHEIVGSVQMKSAKDISAFVILLGQVLHLSSAVRAGLGLRAWSYFSENLVVGIGVTWLSN